MSSYFSLFQIQFSSLSCTFHISVIFLYIYLSLCLASYGLSFSFWLGLLFSSLTYRFYISYSSLTTNRILISALNIHVIFCFFNLFFDFYFYVVHPTFISLPLHLLTSLVCILWSFFFFFDFVSRLFNLFVYLTSIHD